MEGKRFDDIAMLLGRTLGRRQVIRGVLAVLLGGGALISGLEEAGATRPLRGRPYRSTCTADRQCRTPMVCRRDKSLPRLDRNRCGCPNGMAYCNGDCVDLGTEDNCLACGDACASNERCCADRGGCLEYFEACADCEDACDPELSDHCVVDGADAFCACGPQDDVCSGDNVACCNGECIDLTSDRLNCGGCGNVCEEVACYDSQCYGIFGVRGALLDADGNGYTLCNVTSTVQEPPCTQNADCVDFDPLCSDPNYLCICPVENAFRGPTWDFVEPFTPLGCRAVEPIGDDGKCLYE